MTLNPRTRRPRPKSNRMVNPPARRHRTRTALGTSGLGKVGKLGPFRVIVQASGLCLSHMTSSPLMTEIMRVIRGQRRFQQDPPSLPPFLLSFRIRRHARARGARRRLDIFPAGMPSRRSFRPIVLRPRPMVAGADSNGGGSGVAR